MTFKTRQIRIAVVAIALCSLLGVASAKSEADKTRFNGTVVHNDTQAGKHIPLLPYVTGVTLSGMDFAAHASNATTQIFSDIPTLDPFTIPSFDQAVHYLENRHLNLIKLPIAWESLQQSPLNNTLNHTRLETYTDVIATVTSHKASAVLTLSTSTERFNTFCHGHNETSRKSLNHTRSADHNASMKFDDDATNAAFVEIWGKLAYRYKNHRRVIFHLMEIPHGSIPSKKWNETIQAAVTKIRSTGANNVIILPSFAPPDNSTTFNTFRDFARDFRNMQGIQNPDGTTDGIVFDLSLTLGPKRNSSERCIGVNATAIVQPVVKLLREHKRQAIVGTLAASSNDSCTGSLVRIVKQISSSYPHLAGFVLYGAGAYPEKQPWSLIQEGKFSETQCSEDWIDQPNFRSVVPFLSKTIGTSEPNTRR